MYKLLCGIILARFQLVSSSNTFRVALVSEFSGDFHGNSKNFIEGFRDFSVPAINRIGGIPIAGIPYEIDVVEYDTESNSSRVAEVIKAAAKGLDMAGNAVGDVHAMVAGTSKMNKAVFAPAEAAGLVNIHTSGGNPTMWLDTNTYAYGLHLPFIWYTRGPIKMAATRGAKSIAIIRSMAHGFSRASCIAAIQWALDAKLTIVGPSVAWCKANGEKSGGCQVVGQQCVCGSQSDVNSFGLEYNIESTPNFYQMDENMIGNGLVWHVVDADTTAFVQSMFQDMRGQGVVPDIVLNFATEWHNVLKAMVVEDITPQVLIGWQGGTTAEWANAPDDQGREVLTAIDGYWAIGFGQWHSAMDFNDPVFGTNADASKLFEEQRERALDYDTAGAITAGVVLYTALSKHFNKNFATLSLSEKRDAVKQAVGDINDETMWGTLNFNSKHQNIGRGTAAWQIIPDSNKVPQQLCVLPVEAAETLMTMPFPTWASRTGCSAGHYNSGASCELCPSGRANNETTPGLEKMICAQCVEGQGTDVPGMLTCQPCARGRSQDGDRDVGICRKCNEGHFQDQIGSTACISCPLGSYTDVRGEPNCSSCLPGKYQNMLGQSQCSVCAPGTYTASAGLAKCKMCSHGRYAPASNMTSCHPCPAGFTTENIASEESIQCICPQDTYRALGGMGCVPCKEGMTCPLGSDVANFGTTKSFPLLKPGFWSDPSGDHLSVFQCENERRCPGGLPGACAPLLEERSCAHCKDEYAWDGESCHRCSSLQTSRVFFLMLPCIIMPIVVLLMYRFFKDELPKWGSYGNGIATVLYLTLNHYQVIDMLGTTATVPNTPRVVSDILKIWSWSNDITSIFAPECAGFNSYEATLTKQVLVPVALLFVTLYIYFVSKGLAIIRSNQDLVMDHNRLFNVFMSLMFTFFNAVAALSLSLFKCLDNPNTEKTLAADYSVICGGDDWLAMVVVAIFATLVYIVGFASLLLWVVCTASSKIHNPDFQMRWKFLFIKFRLDVWWWAMMYLAKGFLYNLGFVIFLHSLQQLYWLMFLTTIYACALLVFLPYRHRITIYVDGMVCISILYCCTFKMWFAPRDDGKMDNAVGLVLTFSSFSPLLVGGLVVLFMLWSVIRAHDHHTSETKNCNAFCKCVEDLALTDEPEIRRIFNEISEWDRWYMMQVVTLINGERALGIVGHRSRDTLTLGNGDGSPRKSPSEQDQSPLKLSVVQDDFPAVVYDNSACKHVEEGNFKKVNGIKLDVEAMDLDLLCFRETHPLTPGSWAGTPQKSWPSLASGEQVKLIGGQKRIGAWRPNTRMEGA